MLTSRPTLAAALGLALGYGLDRLLGDPRRGHPVAAFGLVAARFERSVYADRRFSGVAYVGVLVGGAAGLGLALERITRNRPLGRLAITAAATWIVLGGRSLEREATLVGTQLAAGDLAAARSQITHLVGRDPSELDADELARACVESVAENTSDAVVAPLFWGAVAGIPGLLAYRAANTLDAMVGHRSPRYRNFGWAAARFDDLLNWLPARLAGLLAAMLGDHPSGALRAMWRDAGAHPSPNAGVVEAAFAGALGLRLGGVNRYGDLVEDRGQLGSGRPPRPADIARTTALARRVALASAFAASLASAVAPALAAAGTATLTARLTSAAAGRRTTPGCASTEAPGPAGAAALTTRPTRAPARRRSAPSTEAPSAASGPTLTTRLTSAAGRRRTPSAPSTAGTAATQMAADGTAGAGAAEAGS